MGKEMSRGATLLSGENGRRVCIISGVKSHINKLIGGTASWKLSTVQMGRQTRLAGNWLKHSFLISSLILYNFSCLSLVLHSRQCHSLLHFYSPLSLPLDTSFYSWGMFFLFFSTVPLLHERTLNQRGMSNYNVRLGETLTSCSNLKIRVQIFWVPPPPFLVIGYYVFYAIECEVE